MDLPPGEASTTTGAPVSHRSRRIIRRKHGVSVSISPNDRYPLIAIPVQVNRHRTRGSSSAVESTAATWRVGRTRHENPDAREVPSCDIDHVCPTGVLTETPPP